MNTPRSICKLSVLACLNVNICEHMTLVPLIHIATYVDFCERNTCIIFPSSVGLAPIMVLKFTVIIHKDIEVLMNTYIRSNFVPQIKGIRSATNLV